MTIPRYRFELTFVKYRGKLRRTIETLKKVVNKYRSDGRTGPRKIQESVSEIQDWSFDTRDKARHVGERVAAQLEEDEDVVLATIDPRRTNTDFDREIGSNGTTWYEAGEGPYGFTLHIKED